ncbi:MAG: hypothetical protein LKE29_01020 [Acidaminococcaceae bacterium]|nr:hypothetical protein [Acidaminococcaceae bacterium]
MKDKKGAWLAGLLMLLLAVVALSLFQGQVKINMAELLAGKLTAQQQGVFWYIRLPRTCSRTFGRRCFGNQRSCFTRTFC